MARDLDLRCAGIFLAARQLDPNVQGMSNSCPRDSIEALFGAVGMLENTGSE